VENQARTAGIALPKIPAKEHHLSFLNSISSYAGAQMLAAIYMRLLLVTLLIFGQLLGLAQKSTRQSDKWDSLPIRTMAELKQYEVILRKELCSTDTIETEDYQVVTYFAANKKKLQQVSNYLDSNNCIRGIFSEYYNSTGLVAFRRGYKKCCPEEADDAQAQLMSRKMKSRMLPQDFLIELSYLKM
jgi:hypothetical protein